MEFTAQSETTSSIPFLENGVVDWENDPLAAKLIETGNIKHSELRQLLEVSCSRSQALGIALVKFGILSEEDLAYTLSALTGLPVLTSNDCAGITSRPAELPLHFLKSVQVIPIHWNDKTMVLAMAEPRDLDTIQSISATTRLQIDPRLGLCSDIQNCIEELSRKEKNTAENVDAEDDDTFISTNSEDDISHLRDLASESSTVQTVDRIFQEAIRTHASDIHFEPGSEGLRVRYRVDGTLRFGENLPLSTSAAINSRIKVMAKLDIAEHRLPQDGDTQLKLSDREFNIQVSTLPILYGESIAIHILDNFQLVNDHAGF